ncbi:MAG: pyridoxamine 5'-phosphate oxidase family protein [Candidatus Saccharimonadales bacterium]
MEEMKKLLKGVFYISTMDGDQPRVRPFDSCIELDGKFYFETANTKDVYRQLKENPKVEIVAHDEGGTVRVTGEAYEITDADIIAGVEREVGKYLNNPALAVFCLQNANAKMMNQSGETETFQF